MSQYYFTASSLPLLTYDEKNIIDINSFLSTCEMHLSEKHFEMVKNSSIKIPENEEALTGIAQKCWAWEKSLRNELVKLRAVNHGLNAESYLHKGEVVFGTAEIASQAMKIPSPLEAENFLNRARWAYLDELSVGHYFDITFLVIYYLKLQILERKNSFDSETGFKKYQEIYQNILGNYESQGVEI